MKTMQAILLKEQISRYNLMKGNLNNRKIFNITTSKFSFLSNASFWRSRSAHCTPSPSFVLAHIISKFSARSPFDDKKNISCIGRQILLAGTPANAKLNSRIISKSFLNNNTSTLSSERFMSSSGLPPREPPPKNSTHGKIEQGPALENAPLLKPLGSLYGNGVIVEEDEYEKPIDVSNTTIIKPSTSNFFIPQVALNDKDGRSRKRILLLCTGGTLTMAPDPNRGGALAPVEGAVTAYMKEMKELLDENMPEVIAHEYSPFLDSSDLGPAEWVVLANDIKANYLHFDGFVILMGTDTMAYAATALSFMLENLGKPVVFTGSQIPLCEPYNDARRNLIMALIFASRNTINEVSIFFHDRLLRACRATKVNTHRLLAFDSPNLDPLATIGITIDESEHLLLPPARGALRVHTRMDTRFLTIRLVPGFDDEMIRQLIEAGSESKTLRGLVLQLYGTGNIPSVKDTFIQILADATERGILVVASTQCFTGSVLMGHYATGKALESAGVVSANDMTIEAINCKAAYLFGRGDLTNEEVGDLMRVSLRGEVTPSEALSPPPLSSAYERASRKGVAGVIVLLSCIIVDTYLNNSVDTANVTKKPRCFSVNSSITLQDFYQRMLSITEKFKIKGAQFWRKILELKSDFNHYLLS